jgi:hypothetical protein
MILTALAPAVPLQAVDKERLESWTFKDAHGNNIVASRDSVARWQRGLQACFDYAINTQKYRVVHVLG